MEHKQVFKNEDGTEVEMRVKTQNNDLEKVIIFIRQIEFDFLIGFAKKNGIKTLKPLYEEEKCYLCVCGKFFHLKDAKYCGHCGRKLEKNTTIPNKILTFLLKWWYKANN